MTTTRKGRRYLATVAKGEATSLQGDKSDVQLEIKEGCPKRAYLMEVRTDPSSFGSIIPDDECFISPIVIVRGCARFAEILSELTKTWSSGATECGV